MKKTKARRHFGLTTAAAIAAIGIAASLAGGCELAVQFDRSLIDGGVNVPADATVDVALDSFVPPVDTGTDTGTDSGGCNAPTDCPAASSDCLRATCTSHVCGVANASSGTTCTSNGGKVCDGSGACVACDAPTDCTAQVTTCLVNSCTSHACGTTKAAASTTCSDNGGKVCDGNGVCVACVAPTDCAAQTTVCKINTCSNAHACGTTNASKGTTCTDNGGTVCDGSGACVAAHCTDGVMDGGETDVDCGGTCGPTCKDTGPQQKCLVAGDCISGVCDPSAKTCTPPTCTDGVLNGAETDKDCGGATCDGLSIKCADQKHCSASGDCTNGFCFGSGPGTCVSCVDGVMDGNETATDCGGTQCDAQNKTCTVNQACGAAADCTTGFCQAGTSTCQLRPQGNQCTSPTQCVTNNCVDSVCCNTACNTTCQACTAAKKGSGADGTCGDIAAGSSAPAGQCTVGATCGNDGKCAAGGTCEQATSSVSCGAALCLGGQFTPALAGSCDGAGGCTPGTPAACVGGFICASGSACKTACGQDNDCQDPTNFYCANPGPTGTCTGKGNAGAVCSAADECSSGLCGTSGSGTRCCAATCTTAGTCGATDCTPTGACNYPTNTTACGAMQCQNGQLTPANAGACDGSGGCTPGSSSPCPGNVICADPSTCKTACASNNDCQDPVGSFCQNPGASGTCVSKGFDGAPCAANGECVGNHCGASGTGTRCCTFACGVNADDCDLSGACVCGATGAACSGNSDTCSTGTCVCGSTGGPCGGGTPTCVAGACQ